MTRSIATCLAVRNPSKGTGVPEATKTCQYGDQKDGAVKPPSALQVELPISSRPSTGPEPSNSGTCFEVVSFQPNVSAVSVRLPSDVMMSFLLARKAFHTSMLVAIWSKSNKSWRYHVGRSWMYSWRVDAAPGADGTYG